MMVYITPPAQLISFIKKKLVFIGNKAFSNQIHSKMFKIQNVHPEFNLFIKINNNQWFTMYTISYIQQILYSIYQNTIFWQFSGTNVNSPAAAHLLIL